MKIKRCLQFTFILFVGFASSQLNVNSQVVEGLPNPFDFPILLSGNFGELRSNHFHAGIDFKTQGVEGKPIKAVKEGYIARVSVSPGGYGNGLYINHPDGTTTVYGHLLRFTPAISEYIKEQQYAKESFSVNLELNPEQFIVKQGEVVAWSGNTGSSGGPHLHFEVRNTQTQEVMDPIVFFRKQIKDTTSPRIQGVMVYPVEGEGVVNGDNREVEYKQTGKTKNPISFHGWGKIGLGIKAYDYMDNTHNIYGVKTILLQVDGDTIYQSCIDRYAFDETRYLNSFVDYPEWVENRSFYMKSFVEPNNRLRFIKSKNRGYITIDEERPYQVLYTLKDDFGNAATLSLTIEGKEQPILSPQTEGREFFSWRSENKFGAKGVRLVIPKGNLYDSFYFSYAVKESPDALCAVHTLHDAPMPLHQQARLSLRILTDTVENKALYGVVKVHANGHRSWMGGAYRNGWMDVSIRELGGSYSLGIDGIAPTITPIDPATWMKRERFVFRISDNLSGIRSYRGEIDGQYVLFEQNNRSIITYKFDRKRLSPGTHTLNIFLIDGCGNESTYSYPFELQ